jgi:hypothetical protein
VVTVAICLHEAVVATGLPAAAEAMRLRAVAVTLSDLR